MGMCLFGIGAQAVAVPVFSILSDVVRGRGEVARVCVEEMRRGSAIVAMSINSGCT